MHLSESVPQDLMCLRSRCVAVRWIQPSDLYVTIEDCSSPSAEPPVPATVHLAPESCIYIPHARSAVELQPAAVLCARALETWFGDLSATTRRLALGREVRARLPPPGRTRPFPARSVESSSPPCPHATQPVRLLPYWDVSAIFVLPSPSDACAPLPAGEDRRRAPTRFVREARGATRVARASAEPACWPSPGPPPGPRGRRFGPPGSKRACGSDTAKRCFRADPASSRLSVQKYLFTRRRFASKSQ